MGSAHISRDPPIAIDYSELNNNKNAKNKY